MSLASLVDPLPGNVSLKIVSAAGYAFIIVNAVSEVRYVIGHIICVIYDNVTEEINLILHRPTMTG